MAGTGTFVVPEKSSRFSTTLTGDPGVGSDGDIYLNEVKGHFRNTGRQRASRGDPAGRASSLAEELRSDEGSTVVSRHQERHIDGTPWSLQTSFYPLSLVQRGAQRLIDANDNPAGIGRCTSGRASASSRSATRTP